MPPPARSSRPPAAVAFEAQRRRRRAAGGGGVRPLPAGRFWELLRSQIRRGSVGAGQLLVEGDLLQRFGSTRSSVRRGLRLLAEEGLVTREVRTGTPVVTAVAEVDVVEVVPDARSAPVTLRIVDVVAEVLPRVPEALAEVLEITVADPVLRLEQVAELGGRPVYLRSAFLPLHGVEDLYPRIQQLDLDPQPVQEAFRRLFGVAPGEAESSLTAVPAGRSAAAHLGVERGSPIVLREMVLRDVDGRLRDLSTTYYRGDSLSLTISPHAP